MLQQSECVVCVCEHQGQVWTGFRSFRPASWAHCLKVAEKVSDDEGIEGIHLVNFFFGLWYEAVVCR
jgi:hypothetical protein